MKFIHTADLHLGKNVNGFSMTEDQAFILKQMTSVIRESCVDAVMIAGDVYDRSVPSEDAVLLFEEFLESLSSLNVQVFIISGNHDSAVRIAFGSRLMKKSGIHFAPPFNAKIEPFVLKDSFGDVNIYMLPFVKPSSVRPFFPESKISSYTDALSLCIKTMGIDTSKRNVIVAHQFVTGAVRSDSEEVSVGGLDNVDSSVFDSFDYAALGHIHGSQSIGRKTVRYSGTPLKYSFSEWKHKKSLSLVELKEKGNVEISEIELKPLRDMRKLYGSFSSIMESPSSKESAEDYIGITLTDEDDVAGAIEKLRTVYPNIMSLEYDNTRTQKDTSLESLEDVKGLSPLDLFENLFVQQNGKELNEQQKKYLCELIEEERGF